MTGNNDVLGAVFQLDVVVRMYDPQIAGVKPAASQGRVNISSIEVEDALFRHPAVAAAAVVARPDDKWGETPCAFVTLKPGADPSERDIIDFCRDNLAHYKCPRTVVFGELPKTSTGKIQKFKLRERTEAMGSLS